MTNENENPVISADNEEITKDVNIAENTDAAKENDVNEEKAAEENTENSNKDEESESDKKSHEENAEFMSDFAPEPMKIPNYDAEKAAEKLKKSKKKKMKMQSAKARRRQKVLHKIFAVIRGTFLFVFIFALLAATFVSVNIKVNTSEYAIDNAIRSYGPEKFVIGKIKDPSALNLKKSSGSATIADVLRDNALVTTTYADIVNAVNKSTYSDFIAQNVHGVISFLLYGEKYNGVEGRTVSRMMKSNISYIKLATGIEIGESACEEFGRYVNDSHAFDDVKPEALAKLRIAKYTTLTEVALSMMVLICLIIALILLIVITAACCSGHAHTIIGWACMLAGAAGGILGYLFRPMFMTSSEFIKGVSKAVIGSFNMNTLICGVVLFCVGLFVLIVGHAVSDGYEEEE